MDEWGRAMSMILSKILYLLCGRIRTWLHTFMTLTSIPEDAMIHCLFTYISYFSVIYLQTLEGSTHAVQCPFPDYAFYFHFTFLHATMSFSVICMVLISLRRETMHAPLSKRAVHTNLLAASDKNSIQQGLPKFGLWTSFGQPPLWIWLMSQK